MLIFPAVLRKLNQVVGFQEFPSIRFRAAKPGENGATDIQSLVAQRIAVNVDERLGMLQRTGQVPSAETCDLIITDRYNLLHHSPQISAALSSAWKKSSSISPPISLHSADFSVRFCRVYHVQMPWLNTTLNPQHRPACFKLELPLLCRGFDPVAPVIHEWTYEAMVYDLLKLNGNVYNYDIETEGGKAETKSHILDERDAIWVELRHQHFAAASLRISSMLDDFRKKNKAASYVRNKGGAVSFCFSQLQSKKQKLLIKFFIEEGFLSAL